MALARMLTNMLANMQAKFATEKIDLTRPKMPITIHEEAENRFAPNHPSFGADLSRCGDRLPWPRSQTVAAGDDWHRIAAALSHSFEIETETPGLKISARDELLASHLPY